MNYDFRQIKFIEAGVNWVTTDLRHRNLDILRSRARKEAIQGIVVAIGAIIVATLLVAFYTEGTLNLLGVISAQQNNLTLWLMDAMAVVFPVWGQFASRNMVREADELVRNQTEELRQRNDQLEREKIFATTHDTVTELANRPLFYDRVEQAIRLRHDNKVVLAVLLLEIANLKEIQDTLGPAAADIIVRQLATRLVESLRARDSVARLSSHTFAILPGAPIDRDQAEQTAHRLLKAIEPPFEVQRLKLSLHSSIGIVLCPEHGDDPDSLVQRAGIALYHAQKSHDGYAVYSPAFDARSPRRLTLMGEFGQAVERGHLELHYQPKVEIATSKVIGAEALVRWRHPKFGLIMPDEFIGMIEKTRMLKPLSQWVMERAFADCRVFRESGHELIVSINLSAKDLHDPELPDRIVGVMAKTEVQANWFIFEITESSIIVDPERVLNVLERINGLGFGLSIDDFGTGYSSLAYLRKLPVTELKIDRSFVRDMAIGDRDDMIVRATIQLAHNLGLKVTAEGVESEDVVALLKGCGCDLAQGYHFSRPIPVSDFRIYLRELEV